MTVTYTQFDSALGRVTLTAADDPSQAAEAAALTGLYYAGQKDHPAIGADWQRDDGHPLLAKVRDQYLAYEAGTRTVFDVALRLQGTPFQRRVWAGLLTVPYGTTISYAELATRIGAPKAVRAVGAAVGRNPVSVIVPCHRIVGSHGALTGYAGGLERKRWLLAREQSFQGSIID